MARVCDRLLLVRWAALWSVVLFCLNPCGGQVVENNASPAGQNEKNARLREVLAGGVPRTAVEMLAIQQQTQKLTKQISAVTVLIESGTKRGSGVIVSTQRHLLTAAHVVGEPGSDVVVVLADGRRLRAKILGVDAEKDIAMAQINSKEELPFAELASSPSYAAGKWCLATGYSGYNASEYLPDADAQPRVAVRLGRVQESRKYVVMTNCSLDHGDSGGPLFNMRGQVIGIHSRVRRSKEYSIHASISHVHRHWDQLLRSARLGTSTSPPLVPSAPKRN